MDELKNLTVIIISQGMQVSNVRVSNLNICIFICNLELNKAGRKRKNFRTSDSIYK